VSCLFLLISLLPSGCRRQGPAFEATGGIDPQVIAAWKKAYTQFGWLTIDPTGYPKFSVTRPEDSRALPAFSANGKVPQDLGEVPAPAASFGLDFRESPLKDADLKPLGRFSKLQILNLGGTQISNAGLKELAGLQQLQTLVLAGTQIGDAGLKELAGLKGLQSLNLGVTNVRGVGLRGLAGLEHLHTLRLYGTKLIARGFKELADLKQLRTLDLHLSNVSDAEVKDLARFRQLEELNVAVTGVTAAGAAELRKAFPKARIVR
jgi:hypothetical protein